MEAALNRLQLSLRRWCRLCVSNAHRRVAKFGICRIVPAKLMRINAKGGTRRCSGFIILTIKLSIRQKSSAQSRNICVREFQDLAAEAFE